MKIPDQIPELKAGDDAQVIFARLNLVCVALDAIWNMRAGPGIKITKSDSNIIIESTIPSSQQNPSTAALVPP